eukprot:CAMPEP_0196725696 /NCGR_PEP_ID=MMETSP1091-20130531/7157_1 /TAXON_ID=302021 /ORGANISM="Rhodomonas sp., Strain CCMP768" /LENGTH=73 /DNA_ID=CAMNT_0042067997 /DNA_START=30 /DNA_END=251 /DNA_ORIENTATION=+
MSSFDPSDSSVGDLTVEQLLDRECEAQIQRLMTSSHEMQQKLRDNAREAKGLLMQKPNKEAENQLNVLVAGIC